MKQFNRVAWFVLALSVVIVCVATVRLLRVVSQPSDGARLDYGDSKAMWTRQGVVIVPIELQSDGLRRNDIVIAVAGQNLETWARALFQPTIPHARFEFDQTLTYMVLREGRPWDVDVTLGAFPLGSFLIQQWGNLFLAILALLFSGFVFGRRPCERAAQVFLLLFAWPFLTWMDECIRRARD